MDFEFSKEQMLLKKSARDFLKKESPELEVQRGFPRSPKV